MSANFRNYAERLARITWDEFLVRASQELGKRWDVLYFSGLGCKRDFEVAPSGCFFFSVEELDSIVRFFRHHMPETIDTTIQQADRICQHKFDLLGYEGLNYGAEIDWHLDAVSGTRAPRRPWFEIDFLNYFEVGDVKVIWELNRHQHLVTLAKAYCYTGDQRYAEELTGLWYAWRQHNPYPIGVNWASSLEVAFRSISWLWVLQLLQKCPLASSRFRSDVQQAVILSGRHIENYLSTYFSPNTHLLGEGVALFFLGILFDSKLSTRWKQRGWDIVLAQAERQVQPDGMHFEQSTYYHVYALDLFLHSRILAAANGISIPEKLDRVLERMLEALCSIARGGTPPRFGDDDGGRLFDPRRNRVEHLLDPLATGAVLFGRSDLKATKPDLVEETIWLLGSKKALGFYALPISPPRVESGALRSSGLYVMAFPEKLTARLTIDAGPHGADGGGHGHADALSVQLTIGGREVLIDAGTFVYASTGSERRTFRGTSSHNTLQVDGLDQAEPAGPFPWRCLPEVCVENWVSGDSFDLLVASHNGYARLLDPVIHRRCIFGLRSEFWLVLDVVEGKRNHCTDAFWHLAPEFHWKLQANAAVACAHRRGLALLFTGDCGWVPHIEESWCSPVYGNRKKNELLILHRGGELPAALATLVLPFADSSCDVGLLTSIHQNSTKDPFLGYRYQRSSESHFLFFSCRKPWYWRELSSDAEFLYYSISESGHKRLVMSGGTYVKAAGEWVFSSSRALSRVEWSAENAHGFFSCSDESAISSSAWKHLASLDRWITGVTV